MYTPIPSGYSEPAEQGVIADPQPAANIVQPVSTDSDMYQSQPLVQPPPPPEPIIAQAAPVAPTDTTPAAPQNTKPGFFPAQLFCVHCNQLVVSEIRYENGVLSMLLTAVACVLLLAVGCCCYGLIPLCINEVKDVKHVCPHCKNVLAEVPRMS